MVVWAPKNFSLLLVLLSIIMGIKLLSHFLLFYGRRAFPLSNVPRQTQMSFSSGGRCHCEGDWTGLPYTGKVPAIPGLYCVLLGQNHSAFWQCCHFAFIFSFFQNGDSKFLAFRYVWDCSIHLRCCLFNLSMFYYDKFQTYRKVGRIL